MISLHTKLKLNPITKIAFHQILQNIHHISNFPINPLTEIKNGKIIMEDDLIAYHIEDEHVYEYIYHEKEHQVVITVDKRSEKQEISLLQYLFDEHLLSNEDDLDIYEDTYAIENKERIYSLKTSLPIVYVSLSDLEMNEIALLAKKLKGMAYVTYGNEKESMALIYHQETFQFKKLKGKHEKIYDRIHSYMTKRVFEMPYTFNELNKIAISKMIEDELIKEDEVRNNYEDLIHDLKVKKAALLHKYEEIQEEIDRLNILIDIKKSLLNSKAVHPLILKSDEVELYPGEHKDLLLKLINEEIERLKGKAHYQERIDLLQGILNQKGNEEVGEGKRLLAVYYDVFGENKRKLSDKDKEILRRNGLYIIKVGGHPKTFFFGDHRYEITAYSSAGDNYAGNQAYRQIRGNIF